MEMTTPREAKARMPMSTAGNLNNKQGLLRRNRGFTLIELTMVILITGFFLSLTLPRLRDVALSDTLKNAVRTMTSRINEVRYQAIKDKQDYLLTYEFGTKAFWADSADLTDEERAAAKKASFTLPSDVRVSDISFRDGDRKTAGTVKIRFTKEGYIVPAAIHLSSEDGRQFTLVLRPFLGDLDVLENYVDIKDVRI
jgi:prepilin-type N-terminal cleavage/methylation domain-containing protein